jgi:hypothetical protein
VSQHPLRRPPPRFHTLWPYSSEEERFPVKEMVGNSKLPRAAISTQHRESYKQMLVHFQIARYVGTSRVLRFAYLALVGRRHLGKME